MPCRGLVHPLTRDRVDWEQVKEHFARDASWRDGRSAVPPWLPGYMADQAATVQVERFGGVNLTATRMLTCPRQVFIETLLDYWVDPMTRFVMTRGTMCHSVAEHHWPEGFETEVEVVGELFGARVTAHIDALLRDDATLYESHDLKFPKDWSVKWRGKKQGECKETFGAYAGEPDSNAAQLNIGRLLAGQQYGIDVSATQLTMWDHAVGDSDGPEPFKARHMDLEALGAHHPGGGEWTVREIVDEHERGRVLACETGVTDACARPHAAATAEAKEQVCASLALVGKAGMYGGKKCTQYCDVEPLCSALVRKYGEPGCER